jgi:FkbM family methyltransferase
MIEIYYGLMKNKVDVTNIVFEKCTNNNIICIPGSCDERDRLFTDPIPYKNKYIFIVTSNGKESENTIIHTFYRDTTVYYDLITEKVYTENIPRDVKHRFLNNNLHITDKSEKDYLEIENRNNISNTILAPKIIPLIVDHKLKLDLFSKLQDIHKKLKLDFGMFYENMSMQLIILKYINGLEKVLEIGGNIGRCSLLIANILNAKSNADFVSLESNPDYAKQLIHNRDQNDLSFHVENSALSNKKMIQFEDKMSRSDVLIDGFFQVNTMSWNNLIEKYKIEFDTLIVDCNDAFYEILLEFPEMLNKMKLVIMKNEYYDVFKKMKVEKILIEKNFILEYSETGGNCPCYYSYYEVWKPKSD